MSAEVRMGMVRRMGTGDGCSHWGVLKRRMRIDIKGELGEEEPVGIAGWELLATVTTVMSKFKSQ